MQVDGEPWVQAPGHMIISAVGPKVSRGVCRVGLRDGGEVGPVLAAWCGPFFPDPRRSRGPGEVSQPSENTCLPSVEMSAQGPQRVSPGQWWGWGPCSTGGHHTASLLALHPMHQDGGRCSGDQGWLVHSVLPSDLTCPGTGPHAQEGQAEAQEGRDPQGCLSRWEASL